MANDKRLKAKDCCLLTVVCCLPKAKYDNTK